MLRAVLVAIAIGTLSPLPADAKSLTLTEVMIQAQEASLGFLELQFGPDPSSPLTFSTLTDLATDSFFFALNAGSTYQGMNVAMAGIGILDAMSDVWNLESKGSLGGASWTTAGSATVTPDGTGGSGLHLDQDLYLAAVKAYDIHIVATFDADGNSTSTGYFTDKDGKKIPGSDFKDVDRAIPGRYNWSLFGDTYAIHVEGTTPETGGVGSFTARLVPEPASLALFGIGLLGVRTWSLRRRPRINRPPDAPLARPAHR
jgi:hypothetical protein